MFDVGRSMFAFNFHADKTSQEPRMYIRGFLSSFDHSNLLSNALTRRDLRFRFAFHQILRQPAQKELHLLLGHRAG